MVVLAWSTLVADLPFRQFRIELHTTDVTVSSQSMPTKRGRRFWPRPLPPCFPKRACFGTLSGPPVRIIGREKAISSFLTLGVCLSAVAFAVGSGWIILNWRQGVKVFLGIIFFGAIVAGLVLNTIFLVREIRRNEQHDSFINAVTHELKTPIASIRLYLQTLQRLEVGEAQRRQFYQ